MGKLSKKGFHTNRKFPIYSQTQRNRGGLGVKGNDFEWVLGSIPRSVQYLLNPINPKPRKIKQTQTQILEPTVRKCKDSNYVQEVEIDKKWLHLLNQF